MSNYTDINNLNKLVTESIQITTGAFAGAVLQSDGSGNASWVSATVFEATVGTSGANFTTVKAAVDAGFTSILVITNVTETANISLTANRYLIALQPDVTWNLDTFNISGAVNFQQLDISGGTITTSYSIAGTHLFDFGGTAGVQVHLNRTDVDQTAVSAANCFLCDGASFFIEDLKIKVPNNLANCGISTTIGFFTDAYNIFFEGVVGASLVLNCPIDSVNTFRDCTFSLTFAAPGSDIIVLAGDENRCSNLRFTLTAGIDVSIGGLVDGLTTNAPGTGPINVHVNAANSHLKDIKIGAGTFDFDTWGNTIVEDLETTGLVSFSGSEDVLINSKILGFATLVAGNFSKILNCFISQSFNISGDNNTVSNSRVGSSGGGGGTTITIDNTANNSIVSDTFVDSALVDNGTNTNISNLVVY